MKAVGKAPKSKHPALPCTAQLPQLTATPPAARPSSPLVRLRGRLGSQRAGKTAAAGSPSPSPSPSQSRTHEDARQLVQHPVLGRSHALQVLLGAAGLRDGTRCVKGRRQARPGPAPPAVPPRPPRAPAPPRPRWRALPQAPRGGGGGGSPRWAADGGGWRRGAAAPNSHHGCAAPGKGRRFRPAADIRGGGGCDAGRPLPARRSSAGGCQGRWGACVSRPAPPPPPGPCPADVQPTGGEMEGIWAAPASEVSCPVSSPLRAASAAAPAVSVPEESPGGGDGTRGG